MRGIERVLDISERTCVSVNPSAARVGMQALRAISPSDAEGAAGSDLKKRERLVEHAWQQRRNIYGFYESYLAYAVASGLSYREVKETLISDWNEGNAPRVVPAGIWIHGTRSGFKLYVLRGKVPQDLFDHFEDTGLKGVVLPGALDITGGTIKTGSVTLEGTPQDLALEPDESDPEAFYLQELPFPNGPADLDGLTKPLKKRLKTVDSLLTPWAEPQQKSA